MIISRIMIYINYCNDIIIDIDDVIILYNDLLYIELYL